MPSAINWLTMHPFGGIPDTAKLTDSCSKEVMKLLTKSGYKGTKLAILKTIQKLSSKTDKKKLYNDGYSFISQANLAEELGIPRRQIQRHLADLVDDGVLVCGYRLGDHQQNFYAVNYDVIEWSTKAIVAEKFAKRKERKRLERANRKQDVSSLYGRSVTPFNRFWKKAHHDGDNTVMDTAISPSGDTSKTPSGDTSKTPSGIRRQARTILVDRSKNREVSDFEHLGFAPKDRKSEELKAEAGAENNGTSKAKTPATKSSGPSPQPLGTKSQQPKRKPIRSGAEFNRLYSSWQQWGKSTMASLTFDEWLERRG